MRYLVLTEKLKLPERPPKYRKDQRNNTEILTGASAKTLINDIIKSNVVYNLIHSIF